MNIFTYGKYYSPFAELGCRCDISIYEKLLILTICEGRKENAEELTGVEIIEALMLTVLLSGES